MDDLTARFGTKEEAEAYARGLRAGLEIGDDDYAVEVTAMWGGSEWVVTVERVY